MTRLNSNLESIGAEFLVLGNLLIEGIQAFKTYNNQKGYDLIATNPQKGKSCRIQVKSRWATDYDGGFLINNIDCDFVVFVALNRGIRYRKGNKSTGEGRQAPEYYVFPKSVVKHVQTKSASWKKVYLKNISDINKYSNNWKLIIAALNKK